MRRAAHTTLHTAAHILGYDVPTTGPEAHTAGPEAPTLEGSEGFTPLYVRYQRSRAGTLVEGDHWWVLNWKLPVYYLSIIPSSVYVRCGAVRCQWWRAGTLGAGDVKWVPAQKNVKP